MMVFNFLHFALNSTEDCKSIWLRFDFYFLVGIKCVDVENRLSVYRFLSFFSLSLSLSLFQIFYVSDQLYNCIRSWVFKNYGMCVVFIVAY
jgi:hypothetical protein